MLSDIATLTGAEVILEDIGHKIEDACSESVFIGTAKKVTVTKDSTVIVDGGGDQSCIDSRIALIKNQICDCSSDYDKEKLQERLAKLSGGVAVIKVGGCTEVAVKELKDRVDDSLNATKAAVAGGTVPGGGATQLAIAYILHDIVKDNSQLTHDAKQVAYKILEAFSSSIYRIIENTGKSAEVVVSKLKEHFKDGGLSETNLKIDKVYNAMTHEYVNPYKDGIIDPAKVIKISFNNAINCIYMLMRCEGSVYYLNEEKNESPSMGGGMGGAGMGGMDGMY